MEDPGGERKMDEDRGSKNKECNQEKPETFRTAIMWKIAPHFGIAEPVNWLLRCRRRFSERR